MAKVKAPLFSFGASGALAESLVFFPWKGLHVVRSYVIPANPRSPDQVIQRGYLADVVLAIHNAQVTTDPTLDPPDIAAYGLKASTRATPRTWFNEICKGWLDQKVAGLFDAIYCEGVTTPGAGSLAVALDWQKDADCINDITAGYFHYGLSKTALIFTQAATIAGGEITATLAGLTGGVKYYWQFRPTAHNDFDGSQSGIYTGTPT